MEGDVSNKRQQCGAEDGGEQLFGKRGDVQAHMPLSAVLSTAIHCERFSILRSKLVLVREFEKEFEFGSDTRVDTRCGTVALKPALRNVNDQSQKD